MVDTDIDMKRVVLLYEDPTIYDGWSVAEYDDGTLHNRWAVDDSRYEPTEAYINRLAGDDDE